MQCRLTDDAVTNVRPFGARNGVIQNDFFKALKNSECDASPRQQRFRRERGEKQSVRHMKSRGQVLTQVGIGSADAATVRKAKHTASRILAGYHRPASALAKSEGALDRKLAVDLTERVGLMRTAISRQAELPRDR
jgi:hypothetical protein